MNKISGVRAKIAEIMSWRGVPWEALPPEIYAEIFVKPLVVGLEVIFQPPPGSRVHRG